MPRAGVKCCVCAAPYTLIIFCTKMMLSHPTDPHKLVKVEPTYDKPAYKRAVTAAYVKISCNCGLLDCSWGSTCEVCGKAEDLKHCVTFTSTVYFTKEHQKLYWKKHKKICGMLAEATNQI
jgi:hypothetical protein